MEKYLRLSGKHRMAALRTVKQRDASSKRTRLEYDLNGIGTPIAFPLSLLLNTVGAKVNRRWFLAAPLLIIFDGPLLTVPAEVPKFIGPGSSVSNFHRCIQLTEVSVNAPLVVLVAIVMPPLL
jgi:hypothetical protein